MSLSRFAQKSTESIGRQIPEDPDPLRTCYMRDRDRVLHSKPFRRMKHKTQVFISPVGDHYRTRLTHTLEVAQIGRTMGRALSLNEDLIEAIALAHDVGHTPFGHAGESALDDVIKEFNPNLKFRHYEQSLRVVDVLSPLNLTQETRAGISGHSKGRADLSDVDGEPTSTLEAAVVRIADRIAYLNHDLDDALRSGLINEIPSAFQHLGSSHGQRISKMVDDALRNSYECPSIKLSAKMLQTLNDLKEWLFENVYLRYPLLFPDTIKAQNLVKTLFRHYAIEGNLPTGFEGLQGAIDYVSGMTDRFAIADYERLFVPAGFKELVDITF